MLKEKLRKKEEEYKRLKSTVISPNDEINRILEDSGTSPITTGARLIDLMKRPQIGYKELEAVDLKRPPLDDEIKELVEIEIKYEGYIKKQLAQVEQMRRLESRKLPEDISYENIGGLRLEAREKLSKIRPANIGQASRISGVSPADISVLLIWLAQHKSK